MAGRGEDSYHYVTIARFGKTQEPRGVVEGSPAGLQAGPLKLSINCGGVKWIMGYTGSFSKVVLSQGAVKNGIFGYFH